MSYQQALEKAWDKVSGLPRTGKTIAVTLLSDTYTIDLKNRTVFSDSCNIPAKEYVGILLLHYTARRLTLGALPEPVGEWIDFKELEGGEGYYPAFKKRTIDRVTRKYGANPEALKGVLNRIPGRVYEGKDAGIVVTPLKGVEVLITVSRSDEEFGPDANILFDKNISAIFCTEDVVVLTELIVHTI